MARYYYKKGRTKVFGTDLRTLAMKAQKYADDLGRAVMIYTDDVIKEQAIRKVYRSNPESYTVYWSDEFGTARSRSYGSRAAADKAAAELRKKGHRAAVT